jgi:hypothetical protein
VDRPLDGIGIFISYSRREARHELLAGKARGGPHQKLDLGPAGADLADDARDLGHGAS